MRSICLQSGSSGNAFFVEAGNVRLLFDAGIGGRRVKMRLREAGYDVNRIDALIISHEHSDHAAHAGALHRLYQIPLYLTPRTRQAIGYRLGKTFDVRHFQVGQTLDFGAVRVRTIPTTHDAVDGAAFIVEHDGKRLGIFTDLGSPTLSLFGAVRSVDAAYLESNYDPHMLRVGPYPREVQARIRGTGGHLSNAEAASLLAARETPMRWVALAHLSQHNNAPEVALRTHVEKVGADYPIHLTKRYDCIEPLCL
ncbi:MAG: MBL fold metallo-hydrolase [Phycisphaerales bacterium]|nr:MBL fold metallo-hydrolase [Phycisphaerales bacterium]